jgi:hypothetical protein
MFRIGGIAVRVFYSSTDRASLASQQEAAQVCGLF